MRFKLMRCFLMRAKALLNSTRLRCLLTQDKTRARGEMVSKLPLGIWRMSRVSWGTTVTIFDPLSTRRMLSSWTSGFSGDKGERAAYHLVKSAYRRQGNDYSTLSLLQGKEGFACVGSWVGVGVEKVVRRQWLTHIISSTRSYIYMYIPWGSESSGKNRQVCVSVVNTRNSLCTANEEHPVISFLSPT